MPEENDNDRNERGEKVEFVPPKGFKPPEGDKQEFDLVCTFRKQEDGFLCMTMLGDTEMPGYDEKSRSSQTEKDNKPSYGEYSKDIMAAGEQQGGSNEADMGGMAGGGGMGGY